MCEIEQVEERKMEVEAIKNTAKTNIAQNPCYDCGKKELTTKMPV